MQPTEPPSIRLARTYDAQRLALELAELESSERLRQPGPYHNGEWTGISLVSLGGHPSASTAAKAGLDTPAPCAVLDRMPYFRSVLDDLACPKQIVRLLWLPAGGKIGEHQDEASGFMHGVLRLHLPIVTHPDVVFMIGGERVRWDPGELWYGDFERVHSVVNESQVNRVHLVLDVEINEFVLSIFPSEFVERQRKRGITFVVPPVDLREADRSAFVRKFFLSGEAMAVLNLGSSLRELMKGRVAEVRAEGDDLIVHTNGQATFRLLPTGPKTARICGMSSAVMFHLPTAPGGAVELAVTGYPSDLLASRLGGDAGRIVPHQRIVLKGL